MDRVAVWIGDGVYERCVAGVVRAFERIMVEMVRVCPWMTGDDLEDLRRVLAAHMAMVGGEDVDVVRMADGLLRLAQRADEVGDRRRAWVFHDWYQWACADVRGEEYHSPGFPEDLAAMP